MKGLFQDPRKIGYVLHQIRVFDHRVGDSVDVGFLKGVEA
jgi:hypothetical protein